MTLICYNKGVIAVDSRESFGGEVRDNDVKLFRHKHFVLAVCGDSNVCAWFVAWARSNFLLAPLHASDAGSEAVLIDCQKKKLYRVFANGVKEELPINKPYCTGCCPSIGIMLINEFNLKPKEVIKTISKYVVYINNKVKQIKCW